MDPETFGQRAQMERDHPPIAALMGGLCGLCRLLVVGVCDVGCRRLATASDRPTDACVGIEIACPLTL